MKINGVEVNNIFTDDEFKILNSFLFEVEKCNQSKIIKNKKLNLNQTITFKKDQVSITHNLIDEDDYHAFLFKVRPFILEKEKTYFMKIKKIIGKKVKLKVVHRYLKNINDEYINKNDFKSNIVINKETLSFDKVFTYYLNAYLFHREEEKQILIEKVVDSYGDIRLFKFYMMNILINKYKAVQKLALVVEKIMKNEDIIL